MRRISNKPRTKLPRSAEPEPAPGEMSILQDFLNTKHLSSPRDVGNWLASHRLLPPGTELTEADVKRLLVVQKGIRALVWVNSGGKLDEAAVDRLDQAAMGAFLQVRFSLDGSSRFESLSRTFEGALGYLLGIVMSTRIAGDWPRFKLCADGQCRAAFYDFSKNGRGRWCKVRCGDRIRSKQYRRTDKYKSGRGSTYLPR